jgi:hypothetical protein
VVNKGSQLVKEEVVLQREFEMRKLMRPVTECEEVLQILVHVLGVSETLCASFCCEF